MKRLLEIFLIFGWIFSCSDGAVETTYDKSVDFNQYETWCWLKGCEVDYEGPGYLYDRATMDAIAGHIAMEMEERGYIQESDEIADIALDFHIVLKEDSAKFARVHDEDIPFWANFDDEQYYHYLDGSFLIHAIDREKGTIIWQSYSAKELPLFPIIDEMDVKNIVERAMENFPRHEPDEDPS